MMKNEITVKAIIENIEQVQDFVAGILEQADCPIKVQMQLNVILDELVSNVARYAYNPNIGDLTVQVEVEDGNAELNLTLLDSGIPYNPLEKPDPDITASVEERPIGGLGIFMVKKMTNDMTYEYEDGKNTLTIRKSW